MSHYFGEPGKTHVIFTFDSFYFDAFHHAIFVSGARVKNERYFHVRAHFFDIFHHVVFVSGVSVKQRSRSFLISYYFFINSF